MTRSWWAMTRLVARRELRERARARSARIFTAILVVAVAAAVIIPALVGGGGSAKHVGIVGPDRAALTHTVTLAGEILDTDVRAVPVDGIASARAGLRDGSLDVVLVADRGVLVKQRAASGVSSGSSTLAGALAQLGSARAAREPPAALPIRGLEPPPRSLTPRLTGMGVAIVIYLLILIYGQRIAQGVSDEKQSRVVELLLATLQPTQLLTGKILGMGLLALAQVAAALITFVVCGLVVGSSLVHGASVAVVAIGALWFVLGYAFYSTAFAAAGSLLTRSSDAGNVAFPLMIPLIVAYALSFSVLFGDVSPFYRVLAFLPPTAPVAMPTIYAVGDASALDLIVSGAITALATVATARLGGLIYGRAIMRTGSPIRLRQLLRSDAARR